LPKGPSHLKGLARQAWRFLSEEHPQMNLDYLALDIQVELLYLAPTNSGHFPISETALWQDRKQKPPHGVRLPARGLHNLGKGGALYYGPEDGR
jgi:hypothetical protein